MEHNHNHFYGKVDYHLELQGRLKYIDTILVPIKRKEKVQSYKALLQQLCEARNSAFYEMLSGNLNHDDYILIARRAWLKEKLGETIPEQPQNSIMLIS